MSSSLNHELQLSFLDLSQEFFSYYLPSLSYRRNRMDLIMAYKILNDLVVVDKDYFLQLIPAALLEQMD